MFYLEDIRSFNRSILIAACVVSIVLLLLAAAFSVHRSGWFTVFSYGTIMSGLIFSAVTISIAHTQKKVRKGYDLYLGNLMLMRLRNAAYKIAQKIKKNNPGFDQIRELTREIALDLGLGIYEIPQIKKAIEDIVNIELVYEVDYVGSNENSINPHGTIKVTINDHTESVMIWD